MDKTYKITLSDGTVLDNLKLNGNNFIANYPVESEIFKNNCSPVVINEEVHPNMELVQVTKNELGEYWFVLRDLSEAELAAIKTRADIEYLAMMCDVEL